MERFFFTSFPHDASIRRLRRLLVYRLLDYFSETTRKRWVIAQRHFQPPPKMARGAPRKMSDYFFRHLDASLDFAASILRADNIKMSLRHVSELPPMTSIARGFTIALRTKAVLYFI
jgi:hypothetical protein